MKNPLTRKKTVWKQYRYYYDGQLINKVSGKRFVYKFVCDLKELLGYSAEELNRLVTECDQRSKARRAASVYM